MPELKTRAPKERVINAVPMGRPFPPDWDFTEWIGTAGFSLNVSRSNRIEYLSALGAITLHMCLAYLIYQFYVLLVGLINVSHAKVKSE